MTHPCAGHACDHCYLCDVVGICCATADAGGTAAAPCSHDQALHDAVIAAAAEPPVLSQLMRADQVAAPLQGTTTTPLALLVGSALREELLHGRTDNNNEEEVERVLAPRSTDRH